MKQKDNNDTKKSRFYQYGALTVAILMILGSGAYATIYITSDGTYDSDFNNGYLSGAEHDFTVYRMGSIYYALNNTNGRFLISDSNATLVIQTVIDELAQRYAIGSLFLRAGDYELPFTVYLWNGVQMYGAGLGYKGTGLNMFGGTMLNCSYNGTILYLAGPYGSDTTNKFFPMIADFSIKASGLGTNQIGVRVEDVDVPGVSGNIYDVYIENVGVFFAGSNGFEFQAGKIWMTECYSESNNGNGVLSSHTLTMNNCYIMDNALSGILIDGSALTNIITNNRIWNNEQYGMNVYSSVENFIISGNVFQDNSVGNTGLYDNLRLFDVENCVIIGNVFTDNSGTCKYHIECRDASSIITLIGNTFDNLTNNGTFYSDFGVTNDTVRKIAVGVNGGEGALKIYNTGVLDTTGDGTTKQFSVDHKLAIRTSFHPFVMEALPLSENATGFYVTYDTTKIYFNYETAPDNGGSVKIRWIATI